MQRYDIIGTSAGIVDGHPWGKLWTLQPAKDPCVGQVAVGLKCSHDLATSVKKPGTYELAFDRYGRVTEIKEVA